MAEVARRALVVRGGWEGHSPVEATDRFIPFLAEHGYDVTVSDSLDSYADAALLKGTDLIVQCWTMAALSQEQESGLLTAVAEGTGLAGWHGGIADSFRNQAHYQLCVGGQFVSHPAGFTDFTVNVVPERADHEIVRGVSSFAMTDTEQYYVHVDPSVDVLASSRTVSSSDWPWLDGVLVPTVWTRQWGEGRVFVNTVGHYPRDFDVPEARLITERGLLWASR